LFVNLSVDDDNIAPSVVQSGILLLHDVAICGVGGVSQFVQV
jgi:hypothetical protein